MQYFLIFEKPWILLLLFLQVAKVNSVEEDYEAFRMLVRDDFVDTGYDESVLVVQPTLLTKAKLGNICLKLWFMGVLMSLLLGCSVKNEVDVDIKLEVDSDVALIPGVIRSKNISSFKEFKF